MIQPVQNKEAAVQRIQSARQKLVSLGVKRIGLFGSFVTGRQTPDSDIDVLVEFEPENHSFDNFMDVSFLLEDMMGRNVDVVTTESLSPYIGPYILREVAHVPISA